MSIDIIVVQFTFSVFLFFLINWIGKHSYSIGYMEISLFVKDEEAPALNFLLRVLTPVVYIIIVSTILYHFGMDKMVNKIYLINIYYLLFRLVFNLATGRGLLLNWYKQLLYWVSIIGLSYLTYDKLISVKANILPDFTTVANELWIIILLFIFQIANNVRTSQDGTVKRKSNYLENRYRYFQSKYGEAIKEMTANDKLEAVVYAILIYETFNRPRVARWIENILSRLSKKKRTLGVMQVKSAKPLSDYQSVVKGTEKVVKAYKKMVQEIKGSPDEYKRHSNYCEWTIMGGIISDYNGGDSYAREVEKLANLILHKFYEGTNDCFYPEALPYEEYK